MLREKFTFTSESVSEGHPDKLCDRISDEIVDMFLREDQANAWNTRVAAETLATTNRVIVAGEWHCPKISDDELKEKIPQIIKKTIKEEIGYDQPDFNAQDVNIEILLKPQGTQIAQGVDGNEGAGDQGIMFGYACNDTKDFMPAPIYYSHKILETLAQKRKSGELPELMPDAKSQISVVYENKQAKRISQIVVSHQHKKGLSSNDVREMIAPTLLECLPDGWLPPEQEWLVNPTGEFSEGGPAVDVGLTGRKIIVDTYGGFAPHGGGAFSGKDCTKVDRSAAYMARYIAKNIVASEIASHCTIQLSYAIGERDVLSVYINADDNPTLSKKLEGIVKNNFDLTPSAIRKTLKLTAPIFARTAAYGHFGREATTDGHFTWEKLDLIEKLQSHF